jgi:hypothetical protein
MLETIKKEKVMKDEKRTDNNQDNSSTNQVPEQKQNEQIVSSQPDNIHVAVQPKNPIKNVNVSQCIKTIIISIIALCVLFVPITFGNSGFNFTFSGLPLIGNGLLSSAQVESAYGFSLLTGLDANLVALLLNIASIAYFVILILNVIFAIILIISRNEICRLIFKIYTIVAGVLMILVLLMSIVHIIGFAGLIIQAVIPIEQAMTAVETSAILTAFAMSILSGALIGSQFRWFEKLY